MILYRRPDHVVRVGNLTGERFVEKYTGWPSIKHPIYIDGDRVMRTSEVGEVLVGYLRNGVFLKLKREARETG
jgi:hypothetical protein